MQRKRIGKISSLFGSALRLGAIVAVVVGVYFVACIDRFISEDDVNGMVWTGSSYVPTSVLINSPSVSVSIPDVERSRVGGGYSRRVSGSPSVGNAVGYGYSGGGMLHCSSSATVHSVAGGGSSVSGNDISNGSNAGNSGANSGQLYASTSVYISSPKISASFRSMSAPVEATYTEVGEEIARRNIRMGRPVDPIDQGDDDTPAVESPVGDGTITLIVLALLFALLTYKRQISLKNKKKQ